jgi:hypothetical protein
LTSATSGATIATTNRAPVNAETTRFMRLAS